MLVCPLPLRMCVCQEARRQFRQWCWPWPGSSRRGPPSSSWCTWGWRAGHGRGKSYWWPSLCSFRRTSFRNSSHSQRPERNRCILLISQIWKHRPIIRDMLLKRGGVWNGDYRKRKGDNHFIPGICPFLAWLPNATSSVSTTLWWPVYPGIYYCLLASNIF